MSQLVIAGMRKERKERRINPHQGYMKRKHVGWEDLFSCNSLSLSLSLAMLAGILLATLYARKKIPSCDTDVFISRQSVWPIALGSLFIPSLRREISSRDLWKLLRSRVIMDFPVILWRFEFPCFYSIYLAKGGKRIAGYLARTKKIKFSYRALIV